MESSKDGGAPLHVPTDDLVVSRLIDSVYTDLWGIPDGKLTLWVRWGGAGAICKITPTEN
ncbi:MAG TPA: hypothetical protein PLQ56_17350 [Aggregatilineales bacterium]|nr:hypothetical protein [Aggregatilineales bacterium]